MTKRQPSLKRPLIVQPLIFQFVILVISFLALIALLVRLDSGGRYSEETLVQAVVKSVVRREDGSLAVRAAPELTALRRDNPGLWFVAEDDRGGRVTLGDIPPQYKRLEGSLDEIAWADIRASKPPYRMSVLIRQATGPVGRLSIMGHGRVRALTLIVAMAANLVVVPIFLLLGLVTVIVTPWIVRRSLAGVSRIASEAERIDVDQRGIRLTEAEVPREIGPLVRAMNDALSRLDEGYQRQQRFIASAAHELRTPIAILQLKIDADGDGPARRLSPDVARLANLAEQLLDLQRLDHKAPDQQVELGPLARRVAADLAPLLIAADKAIEVVMEEDGRVTGDIGAIERVMTNLIQNAAEHGGEHVIVRIGRTGFEVEDDGPGIPADERERIFEPFHRLRPRSVGTGLGLSLVQQVMERHHGRATILDAPSGGAVVRIAFSRP